MAAVATAGPSRPSGVSVRSPPPTSTSGDSESTVAPPSDRGLDTSILQDVARTSLIEILNDVGLLKPALLTEQIQGAKTLVLDPALAGPLGLVTDVSLLKVRMARAPRFGSS